jgi:hypothetical protein
VCWVVAFAHDEYGRVGVELDFVGLFEVVGPALKIKMELVRN